MKPKTRSVLRSEVIRPLYKFLNDHDDLLDIESRLINDALKQLVIADCRLFLFKIFHFKDDVVDSVKSFDGSDLSF